MAQDLLLVETLPHDPEGRRRSDGIYRRETGLREIWLGRLGLGLGLGLLHDPSLHDVKEVRPTSGDANVLRSVQPGVGAESP